MSEFIPVAKVELFDEEINAAVEVLRSGQLIQGEKTKEFEDRFAKSVGAKYAIAVSSGTAALHVAYLAALRPEEEVLVPCFTHISTASMAHFAGCKPIFCDIDPRTFTLDIGDAERRLTERTKAIAPVHLFGNACDIEGTVNLANKHGLRIIWDAAQAHCTRYKGQDVGSFDDLVCYSFYPTKNMITGEGGMITTNDVNLANLARNLRDHAFSKERHFWHRFVGFNYRMTNMQAAVGLAQTEQMNQFVESRRRNAALYTQLLQEIPGIVTPPEAEWAKNVFWMYSILLEDEFGITRDQLRAYLAEHGIETRTFFIPMHLQPIYYETFKEQRYPVSEMLCQRGFYLPSASSLTVQQIEYIAAIMSKAHHEATV